MKKLSYKYLAVLLVATTTLATSCRKYLDEVQPESTFGPEYVFDNVDNATRAILGTYAAMTGDNGYGIRISMYYPYDDDIMMGQGGAPGDNERRDIARYNVQPSNTQLLQPYSQLYSGVERANLCIYYIPRMEQYISGTDQQKRDLRRLHGEALTLRAQYYFELVRNWGDVPAQWQPSAFETDLFKPKTNRDSIYDRILSDLELAATMVPWRTEVGGTSERITQGAVRGLRARIALFRGGYALRSDRTMRRPANYKEYYQIARDECAAIMARPGDHSLNPSFRAIWKDNILAHRIEPNGEVLFEVAMAGGGSALGDSKLGYYNGPRYGSFGNSALIILPTYFYMFDPADTRRDVTAAPYDFNASGFVVATAANAIRDGKFRRDWITNPVVLSSNAQYFGINWPMIRFSDVLLMFAEADNEINNGPSAAARAAFERVRLRAFNNNAALIGTTPSDYTGFFNAIVKERALELGGEGIRKYDLIRWNILGQKMAETKAELEALATNPLPAPYTNLPRTMTYKTNSTTLEYLNSFYAPNPNTTAPAGYANVNWVGQSNIRSSLLVTSAGVPVYGGYFQQNKNELLPFPQAAIDANPRLVQNPGY
ncbi:RagB/SusD family nutrient uptake outer membrane protein [Aridibaculum aurantiacum]|uniref:RagB/SusD family nutrient uptake outer membrane protein n=1 Tax=Aridibaculum aurantiacum TaxID=2810307 RepID=UPI001A978ADB|nr:RagB/SusD family nutrient uptake outer membrane protein [Aridibaculum aurantiacum]